jgi:periplasmic divalent cation tolerance protein
MSVSDSVSHVVVFTTLASADDARSLVKRLVTDRLVACGTILDNARSIYSWQGKLEETPEALVVLKTKMDCWEELRNTVARLHPYNVPELLALPVGAGLPAYLDWIAEQTGEERT